MPFVSSWNKVMIRSKSCVLPFVSIVAFGVTQALVAVYNIWSAEFVLGWLSTVWREAACCIIGAKLVSLLIYSKLSYKIN